MWECYCEECGHEWEADTRVLNGWNMPASDECPNCGNDDYIATATSEMLYEGDTETLSIFPCLANGD